MREQSAGERPGTKARKRGEIYRERERDEIVRERERQSEREKEKERN